MRIFGVSPLFQPQNTQQLNGEKCVWILCQNARSHSCFRFFVISQGSPAESVMMWQLPFQLSRWVVWPYISYRLHCLPGGGTLLYSEAPPWQAFCDRTISVHCEIKYSYKTEWLNLTQMKTTKGSKGNCIKPHIHKLYQTSHTQNHLHQNVKLGSSYCETCTHTHNHLFTAFETSDQRKASVKLTSG